jgi:L-alanine-DL-glutamate epimerase-like enolase superfamily enzyme
MKITEVSTTVYRIPPTVPWEDATHIVSGLEFIIVKIKTNTGLIGTGLSYTVGRL